MENQTHTELENMPLLGNGNRSNAMIAITPKERQRLDAKTFKVPAPREDAKTLKAPAPGEDAKTLKAPVPREDAKTFKAPAPVLRERNSKKDEWKRGTPPNPVKVPPKSLFSNPERYMSPTDSMVSPVTKGLLARNRRPMRILNPWGPPKALENTFQGALQELETLPPPAV